jgi:hypothetical protein
MMAYFFVIDGFAMLFSAIVIWLMHYRPGIFIKQGEDTSRKLFPGLSQKYGKYVPALIVITVISSVYMIIFGVSRIK